MNASANKEILIKIFLSQPTAIENRLVAELTSRNTGTGPKYKWNNTFLCSECFGTTKTSVTIVIKKVFSQPREKFPCCWCSASSETGFLVSKKTVVLRRWEEKNIVFIKRVDKGPITTVKRFRKLMFRALALRQSEYSIPPSRRSGTWGGGVKGCLCKL